MASQPRRQEIQRKPVLHDPEGWNTVDAPMTTAQQSYLATLSREANEDFDPEEELTRAEAAVRIDELERRTGRRRRGLE